MTPPIINTPRGSVIVTKSGKARLVWASDFQPKWQKKYSASQRFVDSEIIRLCEAYIPLRTGMLIKSGILGTTIGSGEVSWIAPYAQAQYYSARPPGRETGPLRGPYWFERMKQVHKQEIIAGCRRLIRGGSG